jgi:hypothetical protein
VDYRHSFCQWCRATGNALINRRLSTMGGNLLILALLAMPCLAWAGPPFITDDPEPVDYQHWEINVFSAGARAGNETSGTAPGLEVNYGALPDVQLHIIMPVAYDHVSGGALHYGYSDTELGVKYRFINPGDDDWWPQVGVFPLLEVPTGDASKGLGTTGQSREFLPIWLQKDFGDWTTYGGGGYWNNPGLGNKNNWFFGWLLQRKITDSLTLGGELFHQTAETIITTPYDKDSTGFNLGGTYDFNETYHALFSAGRGIQNAEDTNQFSYYLALQLTY